MDDARAMNRLEAVQCLNCEANGMHRREHTAAADHLREVFAVDELPDHVVRSVRERGEIVERGDIRMLDLGAQLRLAKESVVRIAALGNLRPDALDDAV